MSDLSATIAKLYYKQKNIKKKEGRRNRKQKENYDPELICRCQSNQLKFTNELSIFKGETWCYKRLPQFCDN